MLNEIDNSAIQLQKDVSSSDHDGNEIIVLRMLCTINKGKSINFIYDIVNTVVYEANIKEIKEEVEEFKSYCEELAKQNKLELF